MLEPRAGRLRPSLVSRFSTCTRWTGNVRPVNNGAWLGQSIIKGPQIGRSGSTARPLGNSKQQQVLCAGEGDNCLHGESGLPSAAAVEEVRGDVRGAGVGRWMSTSPLSSDSVKAPVSPPPQPRNEWYYAMTEGGGLGC